MAIIDNDFNEWVELMRVQLPQAFHDPSARRVPQDFRLQLCQLAFAAGKAAGRTRALQAANGGEG